MPFVLEWTVSIKGWPHFFPLLDRRFENAADKAGLWDEHMNDDAQQATIHATLQELEDYLEPAVTERLVAAVRTWTGYCDAHLMHEEEVLMPLTQEVHHTVEGRAEAVRDLIESVPSDDLNVSLLPYVLHQLDANKPFGPLRMFVESLKVSLPVERFEGLDPLLRLALSDRAVSKLEGCGALN